MQVLHHLKDQSSNFHCVHNKIVLVSARSPKKLGIQYDVAGYRPNHELPRVNMKSCRFSYIVTLKIQHLATHLVHGSKTPNSFAKYVFWSTDIVVMVAMATLCGTKIVLEDHQEFSNCGTAIQT
jgi:hypothetical protein